MKGILEIKDFTGSVQDVDFKNRIVTGYFNNWDSIDSDRDVIRKGAGQKSINERKNQIFFLNQHDWSQPHGFAKELNEDNVGTAFVSNPLPNTSYSNDALILYQEGIVKEHSFGFQTLKSNQIKINGEVVREITEYKLYEFSNVTLGANSNTPFTGFKSKFESVNDLNLEVKKLLGVFRNASISDELGCQLEIAIKMLQLQAYELGKTENTQSKNEPSADTQMKTYEPLLNTLTSFKIN
ncbi:HK97 family phage prohead protease [Chryseobacterium aureum]|uniref:HK97 family phage prohead protease n=1 Tax=Chryseobacterium aureum TaxID=2497456 RepID=UPI000F87D45E|nr:HK97 family phage prohead protease [Chryseobacterium aureum]